MGPVELLIVLAVVLLLFGSKKLPELAKGMGQAAKEFRSGLHDESDDNTDAAVRPADAGGDDHLTVDQEKDPPPGVES